MFPDHIRPAGIQTIGKLSQKCLEGAEFVIDRDAQSLENATDGTLALVVILYPRQRGANRGRERLVVSKIFPAIASANGDGICFVRIFEEQLGQRFGSNVSQQKGGRLPALWIHPHVEWPILLRRKSTHWIIQLHRGDTEICEHRVGGMGSRS